MQSGQDMMNQNNTFKNSQTLPLGGQTVFLPVFGFIKGVGSLVDITGTSHYAPSPCFDGGFGQDAVALRKDFDNAVSHFDNFSSIHKMKFSK